MSRTTKKTKTVRVRRPRSRGSNEKFVISPARSDTSVAGEIRINTNLPLPRLFTSYSAALVRNLRLTSRSVTSFARAPAALVSRSTASSLVFLSSPFQAQFYNRFFFSTALLSHRNTTVYSHLVLSTTDVTPNVSSRVFSFYPKRTAVRRRKVYVQINVENLRRRAHKLPDNSIGTTKIGSTRASNGVMYITTGGGEPVTFSECT